MGVVSTAVCAGGTDNPLSMQETAEKVNTGAILSPDLSQFQHDIGVLVSWIDSAPATLVGLLALAGLFFVLRRSNWDRGLRSEFYLCAWITLALSIHLSTAHPTFERYFLFTTPFVAILASAGLYDIGSRLVSPQRTWRPAVRDVHPAERPTCPFAVGQDHANTPTGRPVAAGPRRSS